MNLDEIDVKILEKLQADGRVTTTAIAKDLGLSTTPVHERIKRMEKDGVIDKFVALVNPKKVDRGLFAFISVSLKNPTRSYLDKFTSEMLDTPEVMECYHIAGNFDFMLKVAVKDIESYQKFILNHLSVISNLGEVHTSFVLSVTKHSTAYAV